MRRGVKRGKGDCIVWTQTLPLSCVALGFYMASRRLLYACNYASHSHSHSNWALFFPLPLAPFVDDQGAMKQWKNFKRMWIHFRRVQSAEQGKRQQQTAEKKDNEMLFVINFISLTTHIQTEKVCSFKFQLMSDIQVYTHLHITDNCVVKRAKEK